MKLYVEMTDEEYENYKRYLNGDYVALMSVTDFLVKKGFRMKPLGTEYDKISNTNISTIKFEQGNIEVYLNQRN